MGSGGHVVVAQPDGLTLTLQFSGSELRVRLSGGGLTAETSAKLDRPALLGFFADVVDRIPPPRGRWEYKPDDDAVAIHARPDGAGGMLLDVSLLAGPPGAADWRTEGTLAIPDREWARVAREVAGASRQAAEPGAAADGPRL